MPAESPLALTRSEQFDELVRTSLSRLDRRWAEQLDTIEVAVDDVPDPDAVGSDGDRPARGTPESPRATLGRSEQAAGDRPARIVVFRRAVEARARSQRARETLVHEVVVERLAELLGLDPATIDPDSED